MLDEDVILYITTMTKRALEARDKEMSMGAKKKSDDSVKNVPSENSKKQVAANTPEVTVKDEGASVKQVPEHRIEGAAGPGPDSSPKEIGSPGQPASAAPDPESSKEPQKAGVLNEGKAGNIEDSSGKGKPSEGATLNGKAPQLNLGIIEMASYTLLKTAFKDGLRFSIKREGVVDMDVAVEGKEITLNTNQLYYNLPDLAVWHIVYTHKGKPILEIGRGVKNGLKVHRLNAIRLGLEAWNGSRKMNKEKQKQAIQSEKEAHQVQKE